MPIHHKLTVSPWRLLVLSLAVVATPTTATAELPGALRVGRAGHAFDHLGEFSFQADAAAASGATIIYTGGLGGAGYSGIPAPDEFTALLKSTSDYNRHARARGIELSIGYLCATSIVKLATFDKNWSSEFRAQFNTPPAEWRQQNRHGQPLPSWYGGDYVPACMSNPDWRKYQHAMVRHQLETGHGGLFFDNPTVHPLGCYCPHCMRAFANYYNNCAEHPIDERAATDTEALRKLADSAPQLFLQFRATIARDFLADMREFARTISPPAIITCNNSLNSPDALFSQSRTYGYNIRELSKAEDYVVVEDMGTQPRVEADGRTYEYGPTYELLHALSHGKPVVAVTIAGGDYHTPPNLMRLAMAEAAAHRASYLAWPTWPESERTRMIAAVRPQADFLRRHELLLNDTSPRADVILFLPFRRWVETDQCAASGIAAALTQANIQYRAIGDDDFDPTHLPATGAGLLIESKAILNPLETSAINRFQRSGGKIVTADSPDWLASLRSNLAAPSITIAGPSTIRAVVQDQPNRVIVHLYNLNVRRQSSFTDIVTAAENVKVEAIVPPGLVRSLHLESADPTATTGKLSFNTTPASTGQCVSFTVPRIEINSIAIIER